MKKKKKKGEEKEKKRRRRRERKGEKISDLLSGFVLDFGGIVKRDLGAEVVKLFLGLGVKILQPYNLMKREKWVDMWNLGKFRKKPRTPRNIVHPSST